jgi:hypothetical protein
MTALLPRSMLTCMPRPPVHGEVQAGQKLVISGDSGWSEGGAHRHFGVRVYSYGRTDSWGGFVNPRPPMRPEDLVVRRAVAAVLPWAKDVVE